MKIIKLKITNLFLIVFISYITDVHAQNSNYKIEFKNGTSIIGQIIKQTDDSLAIKTNDGSVYKYVMTDLKLVSPTGNIDSKVNMQVQPIVETKNEKTKYPISVGLNINYNNTVLTQTKYSPLILTNRYLTAGKFKNNNVGLQVNFIKGISNKFDINAGLAYTKYSATIDYWYIYTNTNRDVLIKYISIPINLSLYNKLQHNGFYFDFGINPQLFFQIIDVNSKEPITKELNLKNRQYRVISFNGLLGLGYYFKLHEDIKFKAGLNYTAELLECNISYFKNSLSTVSNKHNIFPTVGINYTINKK